MSIKRTFWLIAAISAVSLAHADTLLLDGVEGSARTATERPVRGMSMAAVESSYGAPSTRTGAIGEPPISRWDYPAFTVYFEFDHVVHAVERR